MTSREYPDRPLVGVGAVVIHDDGSGARVLLARRGRPPSQGEWSIPGGLVKLGETLEQAILREVREETGLHVRVIKMIEVLDRIIFQNDATDSSSLPQSPETSPRRIQYHYVLVDYLCELEPREDPLSALPASDAQELCWCKPSELAAFHLRPALLQVFQKCLPE